MTLLPLPSLSIRQTTVSLPIIQGGMGIGISDYLLAGAVSKEGGLGVLSSVALDRLVEQRYRKKFTAREACAQETRDAKQIANHKPIGINIMVAVTEQYSDSVLGAMDGGVDVIISGAGLPLTLPEIALSHPRHNEVALVPIASSGRALELICKRWLRQGRLPDAVVVEGPLAGGHIAWRTIEEAFSPENKLDNLIADVRQVAQKYGNIPIIAAGGIYSHEDILEQIKQGCQGVQMGTRFAATVESGASLAFKQAMIQCKKEDIELAYKPGSPCGMLFRVLKNSPFYQQALAQTRPPKCDKGYLLNKGQCSAKNSTDTSFCICNGLFGALERPLTPEMPLYSVGALAYKVDKITTVHDLLQELSGQKMMPPYLNTARHASNSLLL